MTGVKSGRRNRKSDEDAIRQAISLLQGVLGADEPDDGEDDVKANAAAKEPDRSNPLKERLLAYIKTMEDKS